MANFRTHIGFGVFVGIGSIIFGLISSLLLSTEAMIWIFLAVLIGSFLPDMDMDEGVPFQIFFGLFGAGMGGLVFLNLYQGGERDFLALSLVPVAIFALVRFGVGYVFKRFTVHRGMFHSIPAVVLFGLLTIWILDWLSILEDQKLFLGIAVSVGYLGHLVLDEIYSSVNLHGYSIFPKKSLGSALKFRSSSNKASLLFYALIFALWMTLPETLEILEILGQF